MGINAGHTPLAADDVLMPRLSWPSAGNAILDDVRADRATWRPMRRDMLLVVVDNDGEK